VLEQTIPETPRHIDNVIAEVEKDKEPDLVSIGDIMDATDPRACRQEYPLYNLFYDTRGRKCKQPVFSPESLETEFSSDFGTSYLICSPLFSEDICTCVRSANPIKHEVVFIHLSSDSKDDVDVN